MNKKTNKSVNITNKKMSVIRFAGDSGDGIQIVGTQFANATAIAGNELSTLPDYPAEIRAPQGSLGGVSGFQVAFGNESVMSPGSRADFLVVMNPAALKVNIKYLDRGSVVLANSSNFTPDNLKKAGYDSNPLEDGSLSNYRVLSVDANYLVEETLKDTGLTKSEILKTKNFFMLGVLYWIFDLPIEVTAKWIDEKFKKNPKIADANKKVLYAGYNYAENTEIFDARFNIEKGNLSKGKYHNVTGNEASCYALIAASKKLGRKVFYGSYPITPATEILHTFSKLKSKDIVVFQAEDEIAAICASIGAAYSGCLSSTGTSGPGLSLKTEALGLAVISELPLVVVDVQRSGPSTGIPTKTEQSDLFISAFGRHGDSPLVVLAARSPADCFYTVYEASRLAVKYMTPVIVLTSAYIAQGSEPFKIPSNSELKNFEIEKLPSADLFKPYMRNPETFVRPWAYPPMKGYEHRIGGLEKTNIAGNVSHEPENHQIMTDYRIGKIKKVQSDIPPTEIYGNKDADMVVVGWGSTYGAMMSAVQLANSKGIDTAFINIKYLNPLPADLGDKLNKYKKIVVIEENKGQMAFVLKGNYLVDIVSKTKVTGQPFTTEEILNIIEEEFRNR
ncbi:MAG: 2-oxoacid:acceptor oxidoreductase subunit alpha [Elusimicrobiales bacterium]|nr:2-oxoacid:acceptor oxidoreductase subunit alpha [Elusimicrobiales bacterium]